MDPTSSSRATDDPRWLQLPPGPPQTSASFIAGDGADFSQIERLHRVGCGAVGTSVYKVLHRPSGRLYALKVISGHRHKDCPDRCPIFREIKVLGGVEKHPNVVSCHGVRDSDGEIEVLLDYVDGDSLEGAHIQDEQRLSKLAFQMFSGLAHLHERKLVHRDIKPSNLLVDSLGNLKIADWISRIQSQNMNTVESSGRPVPYMSPERINPDLKGGDYAESAGDIWSIGICILEIYEGRFPYARGKQMKWLGLMFKIGNSEPPQAPAAASLEFRDFVACCLQKDPSKRWTADQLLRHPFVLSHNNHQQEVSAESTEPLQATEAADLTKLDLNLSLGAPETASSDAPFKSSDAETEHVSLVESNITDQSESTNVCPSSGRDRKYDRIEHQHLQCDVKPSESAERFEDDQASLHVPMPTNQDWQDSADEPFHGADKCKMKLKSVMIDQDHGEDIGMSIVDENPIPRALCPEDQPDIMQVGNSETSDDEQNFLEARATTGMYYRENDSCCTDPDTEDVLIVPAGQIYQKIMASEICRQIQIPGILMQSHPCPALKKQCMPNDMLANSNIVKKKTELFRECGGIGDALFGGQFQQNMITVINSTEVAISEEQSEVRQSCPHPHDFSLSQQGKLKKGAWSSEEDQKLVAYIRKYEDKPEHGYWKQWRSQCMNQNHKKFQEYRYVNANFTIEGEEAKSSRGPSWLHCMNWTKDHIEAWKRPFSLQLAKGMDKALEGDKTWSNTHSADMNSSISE
ncbi:hypothetical protein SAY86_003607 [Trapa natans]|uniref:mitogen-activated protein kinase kinase n=1 Tax=Trapa natans TaxID=22666 RepID=A0AAN7MD38_TRANT|nr:hypothetical protein SAY86_003607 [Trapa natans]